MAGEVVIVDSGLISAAGNQDESWQTLLSDTSALSAFALPGLDCQVGRVTELQEDMGSRQRLMALIRRGLGELRLTAELAESHLLIATTKGAADEDLHDYDRPGHGFAWQVAAMVAGEIGHTGPSATVSAACASGTMALIQASQMIRSGEAAQVLVVGIDLLSRFVLAGFSQLQALAAGPCKPFDQSRDGLCLGEGIGLMLLTSREVARARHWPALATIEGWGVACDASHITAPCRQASGLTTALRQATDGGRRAVGAINAHGTGTLYNDAMEITAFTNIWADKPPPFHSVKGAIGHCLGAAGLIEACLSLEALTAGHIPPTVGLGQPPCFSERLGARSQEIMAPTILSCNSGFGGINAALLLGR